MNSDLWIVKCRSLGKWPEMVSCDIDRGQSLTPAYIIMGLGWFCMGQDKKGSGWACGYIGLDYGLVLNDNKGFGLV